MEEGCACTCMRPRKSLKTHGMSKIPKTMPDVLPHLLLTHQFLYTLNDTFTIALIRWSVPLY